MPTGPWLTPAFQTLNQPLAAVLGARTAKPFADLDIHTLGDLLRHLPRHLMAGTELTDIASLVRRHQGSDDHLALVARVAQVQVAGQAPRQRVEVRLSDGSGQIDATFFGAPHLIKYWQKLLTSSDRGLFAGKLGWFRGQPQLIHPAFVMMTEDGLVGSAKNTRIARRVSRGSFIGLYPQTAKLPTWTIAECVELALDGIVGLADPLPDWIRQADDLMGLEQAFRAVHLPTSRQEHERGRRRLLFDEAFATQVAMAYRRADLAHHTAVARPSRPDGLLAAFDARLPFALTDQQLEVGRQLADDLAQTRPMRRLLQGEVGSGKTVVALRAMLTVVDGGGQACLLAPTEILAQQHARTLSNLLGDLGQGRLMGPDHATEVALLTGSVGGPARAETLRRIAAGEAGLIVGTHALLTGSVAFADLGLVVVDEQHRFGVEQRNALAARQAAQPHVLVMTATPIPRSVAMTVFGDLDLVTLTERPAGRAQVQTVVVDRVERPGWVERAWGRVREEVAQGRQAYIVAPRIDAEDGAASAVGDLSSVVDLHRGLSQGPLQGLRLGLLHGRLSAGDKDQAMAQFAAGQLDVLIATSMVEVGLDVLNACVMVICDADRFGVSQLHQLRGRIGRGSQPGVCLLLTAAAEGSAARERLEAVASTDDGFVLAQADLAQRREGDVWGLSQSGAKSSLRLLRVLEHADLIEQARRSALAAVARDPALADPAVADYVREIEALARTEIDQAA